MEVIPSKTCFKDFYSFSLLLGPIDLHFGLNIGRNLAKNMDREYGGGGGIPLDPWVELQIKELYWP